MPGAFGFSEGGDEVLSKMGNRGGITFLTPKFSIFETALRTRTSHPFICGVPGRHLSFAQACRRLCGRANPKAPSPACSLQNSIPRRVEDWRGDHSVPFPIPATSNRACGFPAHGSPVVFASKFMWPILLVVLSVPGGASLGSRHTTPSFCTAIPYSTYSSQIHCISLLVPCAAEPFSQPSLLHR